MKKSFWRGAGFGCAAAGAGAILWNYFALTAAENGLKDGHSLQRHPSTTTAAHKPVVASAVPASSSTRLEQITSLGTPSINGIHRELNNHVLFYSHDKRVPLWVQEHLSQDALKGDVGREGSSFVQDEVVAEAWRSSNSDYRHSGWSRGHMAPAGDNKRDKAAMQDSFLLSNIVPQDIHNNGDYWNRMEMYCRDLTRKYKHVWVTSGPAFVPKLTEDKKKIISYQVIGEGEVAVPTHLYKVIVAEDEGGSQALGAFLVPNEPIKEDHSLQHFQLPLQQLEARLGFRFYDRLDRSSVADLCVSEGCQMMSKLEFKQYVSVKRLQRAKTSDKVLALWEEFKRKEIPVTPKMEAAYQSKLKELQPESAAAAVAA